MRALSLPRQQSPGKGCSSRRTAPRRSWREETAILRHSASAHAPRCAAGPRPAQAPARTPASQPCPRSQLGDGNVTRRAMLPRSGLGDGNGTRRAMLATLSSGGGTLATASTCCQGRLPCRAMRSASTRSAGRIRRQEACDATARRALVSNHCARRGLRAPWIASASHAARGSPACRRCGSPGRSSARWRRQANASTARAPGSLLRRQAQ